MVGGGMKGRWSLRVKSDAGSTLVRGWQAGTVLFEGGWRPVWLGGKRSWAVDARHEADVLAYIQSRGIAVVMASKPSPMTSETELGPHDMPADLLSLLEGGGAA